MRNMLMHTLNSSLYRQPSVEVVSYGRSHLSSAFVPTKCRHGLVQASCEVSEDGTTPLPLESAHKSVWDSPHSLPLSAHSYMAAIPGRTVQRSITPEPTRQPRLSDYQVCASLCQSYTLLTPCLSPSACRPHITARCPNGITKSLHMLLQQHWSKQCCMRNDTCLCNRWLLTVQAGSGCMLCSAMCPSAARPATQVEQVVKGRVQLTCGVGLCAASCKRSQSASGLMLVDLHGPSNWHCRTYRLQTTGAAACSKASPLC